MHFMRAVSLIPIRPPVHGLTLTLALYQTGVLVGLEGQVIKDLLQAGRGFLDLLVQEGLEGPTVWRDARRLDHPLQE